LEAADRSSSEDFLISLPRLVLGRVDSRGGPPGQEAQGEHDAEHADGEAHPAYGVHAGQELRPDVTLLDIDLAARAAWSWPGASTANLAWSPHR
jgi:hypothetical protein